ncbi:MAG: DUF5655 domain-containing protein [Bacteroidota bacterium]
MWTCPKCNRQFKTTNQSHTCNETTLDDLFLKCSDELILAFDRVLSEVINWQPCSVGAAKKAVVFTSKKAWLILRPMTKALDLKFYHGTILESDSLHQTTKWGKKYAHHIRIRQEEDLTEEVFDLLRNNKTITYNICLLLFPLFEL